MAIALNHLLLEKNPRDAEAYNRIGRAKLEQGLQAEAIDAYTHALKVDKANLIAAQPAAPRTAAQEPEYRSRPEVSAPSCRLHRRSRAHLAGR